MVGSLNSPLAMLIVGALLARYKLSEVFKGLSIYFVSLMRLVIIPLLVYGIMVLLSMPGDVTMVVVILSAMPVAVTTVIFAEQYGADSGLASEKCRGDHPHVHCNNTTFYTLTYLIIYPAFALAGFFNWQVF